MDQMVLDPVESSQNHLRRALAVPPFTLQVVSFHANGCSMVSLPSGRSASPDRRKTVIPPKWDARDRLLGLDGRAAAAAGAEGA